MEEKIEQALSRFATKSEIDQLPKHLREQIVVDADGNAAHRGFLKRSHLFRVLRCLLSPSEYVVIDFLWDAAWDGCNSRGVTRKSLSKIEEGTSLKVTAIKAALKSLQARKLIVAREKSMKQGMLWQISSFLASSSESQSDLVEIRPSRETTGTKSENVQPLSRLTARYKELSKEILLENSLSTHFADLKAPQKRESELGHFQNLSREFTQKDIADCLDWIKARGLLLSGEPVHSPMAYLSQAMGEVLKVVQESRMKEEKSKNARQVAIQVERERQAEQTRDAAECAERQRAFEVEFPTPESQGALIAAFCKRMPWAPKGQIAKNLAIQDWWEGRSLTCTENNSTLGGACA